MDVQKVKCMIVGDSFVGKTTMIEKYTECKDGIPFHCHPTPLEIGENKVDLIIQDTIGEHGYDNINQSYYPDTDVVLLCFSLVEPCSYENIYQKWHPEVTNHCPNIPVVVVGTKNDLAHDPEQVNFFRTQDSGFRTPLTSGDGLRLCEDIGAVNYVECSAATRKGVKNVFIAAARAAMQNNVSRMIDTRINFSKLKLEGRF